VLGGVHASLKKSHVGVTVGKQSLQYHLNCQKKYNLKYNSKCNLKYHLQHNSKYNLKCHLKYN
jgi:hypothetical protein